jgi:hypothetical protein
LLFGLSAAVSATANAQVTINKRIAAASDDAEEEGPTGTTPNRMWLSSSDIELVSDFQSPTAGVQKIGLRFTAMTIPVGATITGAYLNFRAIAADPGMTNGDATSLTIRGQLATNATTFTTTSGNISSRTLTTASASWVPTTWSTGSNYNSPSVVSIVQEIVNQGGWASGNALAIIITGTGHRASTAWDTDAANAAELVVTYVVPFYSKGSLAVNTPANWNTARDGSGANATSFGTGGTWIVQNGHSMTLAGSTAWDVSSSGTVQIESGGTWTNTSSGAVTIGTLQVDNGGTYSHGTTAAFPATTRTLGSSSTVNYSTSAQTVAALSYGNLTFSNSGTKTMPATAMSIAGNFTMSGTAAATAAEALTVNGTVTLGAGTSFNAATFSHSFKGNVSNSGTFTASTSTVTLNGTGAQTVSGSSATTFNALTINNASGVSLSGVDATVSGALTFTAGLVTTGANSLILGASGSVSRTSGHVVGNFRKNVATGATTRTFEIGDATNYTPVTVVFASVSVAGNLTGSTVTGDHPSISGAGINAAKSVNRNWTLTNSGVTFTTYSATFTFVPGDVDGGAATGSFIVGRYAASAWTYPTVGTRTSTTTQLTGASAFGDYQLGEAAYSLSGNVFEDVNYGGGSGRSKAAATGVSRSGARVELYTSLGAFSTFTTTNVNGDYTFAGLAAGTYYVRVVNSSVTSSRTGYTSAALAVQTYRTSAATGTAVAVTDFVGGTNPAVADPGNGSAGATFNTTTFVYSAVLSGTAQSVIPVVVGASNITDLDAGFNFDVIVNTNNSGPGSLRQFIDNANLLGGDGSLLQAGLVAARENAVFMLSNGTSVAGLRSTNNYFSGGVATITVTTALPSVITPVVLDGTRQPGFSTTPVVLLTGAGSVADGIQLYGGSGGSTIRGLTIRSFTGDGIDIASSNGNTIAGNWLGLNASGSSAAGNGNGINIWDATGNIIGGLTSADQNILSGNTSNGLAIGGNSTGNQVRGNRIGTNPAGTAAIGNTSNGIYLNAPANTIGGDGGSYRNVISGNTYEGIAVASSASGTIVQGNYIGLDASGTLAIANGSSGVAVSAPSVTIGGTGLGAGNVVSGNTGFGINVTASGATLQGNIVGLDAAGATSIGNQQDGVWLASTGAVVGGNTSAARNVISGNVNSSVFADGIYVSGSSNTIQGNYIGTDITGTLNRGNWNSGVALAGSNNLVGGTGANEGNLLAFNRYGTHVTGNVSGNRILGNSIFSNSIQGIELIWSSSTPNGITPNDGAKTTGQPNLLMDFPVLTSAILSGTTLTVAGYVGSAPGQTTFASSRVEIFVADITTAGNGQGRTYLGALTADANGNISGTLTGVTGITAGTTRITGTATDAGNNTSEFGANVITVAAAPTLTASESATPSGTQPPGTDVTFTATFTNVGTAPAQGIVISNPVPANTDFKLGSVTQNLGTTGLTVVVAYSSNGGTVWTYTPVSGAGGAPAGYDRLVTHVRWTLTGTLSQTAPNNTGTASAIVRIR